MKITAAIADAVTPEQVHCALVDEVAAALGASSAGLWLVADGTLEASLARSVGYVEEQPGAGSRPSPWRPRAGCRSSTPSGSARPIWISSQSELLARYPHLAGAGDARPQLPDLLPPHRGAGTAIGGLALTFDGAPPIDREQRDLMLLVARYSGQALERLRLLDLERRSRAQAEAAAARLELLSRASRAISEAGHELPRLLQAIAEQVTRRARRRLQPSCWCPSGATRSTWGRSTTATPPRWAWPARSSRCRPSRWARASPAGWRRAARPSSCPPSTRTPCWPPPTGPSVPSSSASCPTA